MRTSRRERRGAREMSDVATMSTAVPSGAARPDASTVPHNERPFWREILEPYARPHLGRSLLDIATSVVPYLALSVLMYLVVGGSYWLALAIAVPASGFLLRTYILFHDCSHGSFLPSRRANVWLGTALGLIVYSPFQSWRHSHAVHHATAGDLDRRGVGDVHTLTVAEYAGRSWRSRLGYRLFRNPLVMFGLGPIFSLLVLPRLVSRTARPRIRRSVIGTNIALVVLVGALCLGRRLARLPARADPHRAARRLCRRLAVLCPAPVRGHLLAEQRRLDLRRRRAARQLLPEAAEGAAVLHRQHRRAPRPPSQRPHPQLQPAARARREPDLPRRADAVALGRPAGGAPEAVGRGSRTPGDLRRGAPGTPVRPQAGTAAARPT